MYRFMMLLLACFLLMPNTGMAKDVFSPESQVREAEDKDVAKTYAALQKIIHSLQYVVEESTVIIVIDERRQTLQVVHTENIKRSDADTWKQHQKVLWTALNANSTRVVMLLTLNPKWYEAMKKETDKVPSAQGFQRYVAELPLLKDPNRMSYVVALHR